MIAHAVERQVPLDFVFTHVYGNDLSKDVFGTDESIDRSVMVSRAVQKVFQQVKASPRPNLPIIWSEYNASYKNEIDVTDAAFMGPWLANNIRLCDGLTTMMSYWTFSDVFEEQGVIKTPFYGGYGLIAEGGVPKAAFNAFAMLHRLGDQRSQPDLAMRWSRNGRTVRSPSRSGTMRRPYHCARAQNTFNCCRMERQSALSCRDCRSGNTDRRWGSGRPWVARLVLLANNIEQLRRASAVTQKLDGASSFMLPSHGLALVEVRPR